jgi:hypothetical protein
MSRTPYHIYIPSQSPPPVPRRGKPSRAREVLLIAVALVIAAGVIGGFYVVANHVPLPFAFPGEQPTPAPSLKPVFALKQIQHIYPNASVAVNSPLPDEVDLVTNVNSGNSARTQPKLATEVLSLYIRGYSHQTFWRWTDIEDISGSRTTFEVHPTELWTITLNPYSCPIWTIYVINPQDIIARGISGQDYATGVPSHQGQGTPPGFASSC